MQLSLIVTIALAFAGWLITHRHARELARRKDELELVNRRLGEFYGPLYVATQAGTTAYETLLKKLGGRKKMVFEGSAEFATLPKHEQDEWLNWMRRVFMPLNELREKLS